jgi:hypothetical protein
MQRKPISRAEIDRVLTKHGIKWAGPDHPVYSEGPSITFSSRTPKQSQQKAIVSLPTSSPTDSD